MPEAVGQVVVGRLPGHLGGVALHAAAARERMGGGEKGVERVDDDRREPGRDDVGGGPDVGDAGDDAVAAPGAGGGQPLVARAARHEVQRPRAVEPDVAQDAAQHPARSLVRRLQQDRHPRDLAAGRFASFLTA
jgi:hypothetical protein